MLACPTRPVRIGDGSEPASKDSIAASQEERDLAVTGLARLVKAIYSSE